MKQGDDDNNNDDDEELATGFLLTPPSLPKTETSTTAGTGATGAAAVTPLLYQSQLSSPSSAASAASSSKVEEDANARLIRKRVTDVLLNVTEGLIRDIAIDALNHCAVENRRIAGGVGSGPLLGLPSPSTGASSMVISATASGPSSSSVVRIPHQPLSLGTNGTLASGFMGPAATGPHGTFVGAPVPAGSIGTTGASQIGAPGVPSSSSPSIGGGLLMTPMGLLPPTISHPPIHHLFSAPPSAVTPPLKQQQQQPLLGESTTTS